MASQLITCPSCECHAKSSETSCPHCGAPFRREDNNRLPRSATAVALGLSAVLAAVGCDEPIASPVYGVAVTGGAGGMGNGGEGGMGGHAGHAGHGGKGGEGGQGGKGGMGMAGAGGMGGGGGMGGQGG